jgi:DNA-binding PadR family transcriptional regulator
LELLRAPSYGYDLIRRLSGYGFRRATEDPGVVYKVLRSLEDAGSIGSEWSTPESGPARRYYRITDAGRDHLRHRVQQLKRYQERVDRLLADHALITGEGLEEEPLVRSGPSLASALAGSERGAMSLPQAVRQDGS